MLRTVTTQMLKKYLLTKCRIMHSSTYIVALHTGYTNSIGRYIFIKHEMLYLEYILNISTK